MTPLYQSDDNRPYIPPQVPVPYRLVLLTVLTTPEEVEAYLKRGVQVLYSNRDDKWRALEVVEKVS